MKNTRLGDTPKIKSNPKKTAETTAQKKELVRKVKYPKWVTFRYIGFFERAGSGRSKSNAIIAKCLECTCCQPVEITNCDIKTCPLLPYRPYQRSK